MRINRLRAREFRNLREAEIDPGDGFCILFGENAQGKTNLLESIYFLSNLQSFRTRDPLDLVRWGAERAWVGAEVEGCGGRTRLEAEVGKGGRKATVDGKPPDTASSYLRELPTILFSPSDLDLVRGRHDLRRRYADRAAFLGDTSHLGRLREYNRALRQRNAALRARTGDRPAWDATLAAAGAAVRQGRTEAIDRLGPQVSRIHAEVSGDRDAVEVSYRISGSGCGGGEEGLLAALEAAAPRDERSGYTTVGPHRDTLGFRVNGEALERHASQGQFRSLALCLKLALLGWGLEHLGEPPVFLLDDPGSELDRSRLEYLGAFLGRWPGQVILAATEREAVPLPPGRPCRAYRLERGQILDEH